MTSEEFTPKRLPIGWQVTVNLD